MSMLYLSGRSAHDIAHLFCLAARCLCSLFRLIQCLGTPAVTTGLSTAGFEAFRLRIVLQNPGQSASGWG